MRFGWHRADLARTCEECGHTWRVPHSAARRRIGSIAMFSVAPGGRTIDRGELAREVAAISAANQAPEAYQHCPACGADRFTQRAVRHDPPA